MPVWYQSCRSSMLLLQSLMFTAAFGYAFHRQEPFLLRLITSTVVAMLLAYYSQQIIYIPGDSLSANLSHAVVSLINYLLLLGVIAFTLNESGWTIVFLTTMSSVGSSMGGCIKTLLRMAPAFAALTRSNIGIIPADIICYGDWRCYCSGYSGFIHSSGKKHAGIKIK